MVWHTMMRTQRQCSTVWCSLILLAILVGASVKSLLENMQINELPFIHILCSTRSKHVAQNVEYSNGSIFAHLEKAVRGVCMYVCVCMMRVFLALHPQIANTKLCSIFLFLFFAHWNSFRFSPFHFQQPTKPTKHTGRHDGERHIRRD